jgi:translocation and assembly module TamA
MISRFLMVGMLFWGMSLAHAAEPDRADSVKPVKAENVRVRGAPGKGRRAVSLAPPTNPIFDEKPNYRVEISGVWGYLQDNVRAYLDAKRLGNRPNEEAITRFYRTAHEKIRASMQAVGYYQASSEGSITQKDDLWIIRFDIKRGLPIKVVEVDVQILDEGAQDRAFKAYLQQMPLRQNAVLDHGKYESVKSSLTSLAAQLGYFDAKFTASELRVDTAVATGGYVLHFATGKRYQFGEVKFNNGYLRADLLQRYVKFAPGQWYDADKLLELEALLSSSGYYESVDIQQNAAAAQGRRVPIHVNLKPDLRHKYSAGMGYGTDTKLRISGSIENRRVNRRGHRLGASLQASSKKYGVSSWYDIPLNEPATDRLSFLADWEEVTDSEKGESEVYSITTKRISSPEEGWRDAYYVSVRNYNSFTRGEGTSSQSELLVLPGITWGYRKTDNILAPLRGHRWGVDIYGTDPQLGTSELTFLQLRADAKWIENWKRYFRTLVRAEFGATVMPSDLFEKMPPDYRFAAGGDQSVRGYDFDSLGPTQQASNDSDEIIVGGRNLVVASIEQEIMLGPDKRWRIAAFFDVGNAVNALENFGEFKRGAGVGIRWISPVGPIRVDLAHALVMDDETVDSSKVHISMGPDL